MAHIAEINGKTYYLDGPVRRSPLPDTAPAIRTIGQPSRANTLFPSWEISDLSKGVGVRDFRVDQDEGRYWTGDLLTHFAVNGGWTLPPRKVTPTGSAVTGTICQLFTLGGTLYAYTLELESATAWAIRVYSWAASTTTWTLVDSLTAQANATGFQPEGGQVGVFGGVAYIPLGSLETTTPNTRYVSFDGTTLTSLTPASAAVWTTDTQKGLAFIQHRGTMVALVYQNADDTLHLIKTTTPGTVGSWVNQMGWSKEEGVNTVPTLLKRPFTPIWMVEGVDRDGVLQLYVMADSTVWQVDWSSGIVFPIVQAQNGFVGRSITFVAGSPLGAATAPMLWWGADLVTITRDDNVFVTKPDGGTTDIGLMTRDGQPTVADADALSLHAVQDLLLMGTTNKVWIYTGKGWGPLSSTGTGHLYWDGSSLHYVASGALFYLDMKDLDRATEIGARTYENTKELETARFDAGFPERTKTAYRLSIRANDITSTETIAIEYKTDAVSSYTALTTMNSGVLKTVAFGASSEGLAFKWIQFKVKAVRGTTTTKTPVGMAVVLDYEVLPDLFERFTLVVDVDVTVAKAGGTKRSHKDIDNELLNLIDPATTSTLVTFKFAHKDTRVRVTGIEGVSEETSPSQIRGGFGELEQHKIMVRCEERT